jgi:hypothetical protein
LNSDDWLDSKRYKVLPEWHLREGIGKEGFVPLANPLTPPS